MVYTAKRDMILKRLKKERKEKKKKERKSIPPLITENGELATTNNRLGEVCGKSYLPQSSLAFRLPISLKSLNL